MIKSYQEQQRLAAKPQPETMLARIGSYNSESSTATLIFPGETIPTIKAYKCNSGMTFEAGQRVRIAKISGTYVVEYPI